MGPFQRQVERTLRGPVHEGSTGFGVGGGIWTADLLDDIVQKIQKPIFDAVILELVANKITLRDASSIGLEMSFMSEDGMDPFVRMSLGIYPGASSARKTWQRWQPKMFHTMFPQTWELFDKYGADTTVFVNGGAGFIFRTDIPVDSKGSRVAHPASIPNELIGKD